MSLTCPICQAPLQTLDQTRQRPQAAHQAELQGWQMARDADEAAKKLLTEQKAIQQIPETITPGNLPDMKAFEPNLTMMEKMQEVPANQEIDLTPNVKEITNFIRANDPGDGAPGSPKATDMAKLLAPQTMAAPDIAAEMASVRRDVLSKPVSEKQMLLDAGALDPGEGGKMDSGLLDAVKSQGTATAAGARVKGFSNLDDLLIEIDHHGDHDLIMVI